MMLVLRYDNRILAFLVLIVERLQQQVAFQSNANHPLAESMGYIKFEGM